MKTERGKRLIFVVGSARSGTTLVQTILDSHPDICAGPEFHHIPGVVKLREKIRFDVQRKSIDFICSLDQVDDKIGSLVESFFLPLADKFNSEYYSEKDPLNIQVVSELIELFPKAKFISIVRDPRAVAASLINVGKRGLSEGWNNPYYTHSIIAAKNYIATCYKYAVNAQKAARDRVITIRYEDLVKDPKTETKKICNFFELDWSSKMLHPNKFEHSIGKQVINKVWYTTEEFYQPINIDSVEKWKDRLSIGEQIYLARSFRNNNEAAHFGYDFNLDYLSVGDRISGEIKYVLMRLTEMVKLSFTFITSKGGYRWLKRRLILIR
jgi:hypothetical protein